MGETFGFDLQGLDLAILRRRALDFFDHMPQVIRLAAHVLASARELLLAPLEVAQPLIRIAHRRPLDRRVGVRVQHVSLGIDPQQGLGLVLAVQVHEQRAELRQDVDGGGAAVDPGAGPSLPGDLALQHQAAVVQLYTEGGKGR